MANLRFLNNETGIIELWEDNGDGTFSRKISSTVTVGDITVNLGNVKIEDGGTTNKANIKPASTTLDDTTNVLAVKILNTDGNEISGGSTLFNILDSLTSGSQITQLHDIDSGIKIEITEADNGNTVGTRVLKVQAVAEDGIESSLKISTLITGSDTRTLTDIHDRIIDGTQVTQLKDGMSGVAFSIAEAQTGNLVSTTVLKVQTVAEDGTEIGEKIKTAIDNNTSVIADVLIELQTLNAFFVSVKNGGTSQLRTNIIP